MKIRKIANRLLVVYLISTFVFSFPMVFNQNNVIVSAAGTPSTYLTTPKNASENITTKPLCRIWANQSGGVALTVNFYENTTGSWVRRQTNSSVPANSTVQWNYSQVTSNGKYYWKTTIYDGTTNLSKNYYFSTKAINWSDNFESYAVDTRMNRVGGWYGWNWSTSAAGIIKTDYAHSGTKSLMCQNTADQVREFYGFETGTTPDRIVLDFWMYVPTNFTGLSYLVLNDVYKPNTVPTWITEVKFKASNNSVWSIHGTGSGCAGIQSSTPLIKGRWVLFRMVMNMTAKIAWIYYNGTLIYYNNAAVRDHGFQGLDLNCAGGNTNIYFDDFNLTTLTHMPKTYLVTPQNQTTGKTRQQKCRIWANDTRGDPFTVNFYENSSGSWIKQQRNTSVPANSTVQWNYSNANSLNQRYYWRASIFDGILNISKTYYFTTSSNNAPTTYLITPQNQTTTTSRQPKCKVWANDSNGNTLTINFYENSTTGTWRNVQKNASATANTTIQWNYSNATCHGAKYWWKATIDDGAINISKTYWFKAKAAIAHVPTTYLVSPKNQTIERNRQPLCKIWANDTGAGLINGSSENRTRFKYGNGNGRWPSVIRLENSSYYAITEQGNTSSGDTRAVLKTIQVWPNGTIRKSTVDSYVFDTGNGYEPNICHVYGDVYAIFYGAAMGTHDMIKTFRIWDSNGTIRKSYIDTQLTLRESWGSLSNLLKMGSTNIFVFVEDVDEGKYNPGYINTIYIDNNGNIGDTINDTVCFNATDGTQYQNCTNPRIIQLDSDTVAVAYESGTAGETSVHQGYMSTWNISASGDITNTRADFWTFEPSISVYEPFIFKVNGSTYAIAYSGPSSDGWMKTFTIANTGMITKSAISSYEFDPVDARYTHAYSLGSNTYAITYQGTNTDGFLKTVSITKAGAIGGVIDTLEFDPSYSIYEPDIVGIGESNYLIVWCGEGITSRARTVTIASNITVNLYDNATRIMDRYEWNANNGGTSNALRIGTSDYYLIAYSGPDGDGWVNTTKVWPNNGTIQKTTIDSLEFDTGDGQYPALAHVTGHVYAVVYASTTNIKIKTFTVDDENGSIGNAVIDTITSSHFGKRDNILQVHPNVFSIAYSNWSSPYMGYLETVWIDDSGAINDTFLDSKMYKPNGTNAPKQIRIDDDTIAIAGDEATTNYGYIYTINISSSGIIANTSKQCWRFEATRGYHPNIINIYGNIYAVTYSDPDSDGRIATLTIADNGTITRSWIDTSEFDAENCSYSVPFNISSTVRGIAYQGTDSDGYVCAVSLSNDGMINERISSLEFDTADCGWFPAVTHVANDIYLITYVGTASDGWSCTVDIPSFPSRRTNNTNSNSTVQWNYNNANEFNTKYWWRTTVSDGITNISRLYYFTTQSEHPIAYLITPKNQSLYVNRQPKCRIWANDSKGDVLTINFYENTTGTPTPIWVRRQKNASVTANSTIQWNYTQATSNNTKYWWKVTVDDGTTNITRLYYFTTIGNHYPMSYLIAPKDGSTNVNRQPKVRIWANDTGGGTLTVTWYNSSDNYAFYPQQTNSSVPANSIVQWNYSQATGWNTGYYWTAMMTDGYFNSSFGPHYFTTKGTPSYPSTTYLITPKNQSVNVSQLPRITIYANDSNGGTLTVRWYDNTSGSWVLRQTNSNVVANSTVSWFYIRANGSQNKYWWKAVINDGSNNVSTTFWFVTSLKVFNTFYVDGFVKYPSNPILTNEWYSGNWDYYGIRDPTFMVNESGHAVTEGGKYILYYSGRNKTGGISHTAIGRATSIDGITWTECPYNPVIINSTTYAMGVTVIKNGIGDYVAYYNVIPGWPGGETNYLTRATSTDGINWTNQQAVHNASDDADPITGNGMPYVTKLNGKWYCTYEAYNADEKFRLYMYSSDDGINWTDVNSGAPLYQSSKSWENTHQANPKIYKIENNKYMIIYDGAPSDLKFKIGILISNDITGNWTAWENNPILSYGSSGTWESYRIESPVMLLYNDSGTKMLRLWYFGLPTSDSFKNGSIGLAVCTEPGVPTTYLITPKNQSIDVNKQPKCRIWANNSAGGTLTINFYENTGGPVDWARRQTNTSVLANTTIQWNHSLAISYGHKYYWKTTIDDGTTNITRTYWFTLKGITTYLITPKNQSTRLNKKPNCRIWANDTAGDTLTVNWYSSNDGAVFTRRQKNTSIAANSTIQWNYSQATSLGNKYYWKATIDDGTTNLSKIYWFALKAITTYVITPKNQSVNVNKQPNCKICANDSAGDSLIVNFYENSTGSWVRRQLNSVAANSTVQWNYSQATSYGKKYKWKVTIYDGTTNISNTYIFTVKAISIYLINPKNESTGLNHQPICQIWTNSSAGGTFTVNWYSSLDPIPNRSGISFVRRQTNSSVPANSTVQWNYTQATTSYNNKYYWRATVYDGRTNFSKICWFTVKKGAITTYLVAPKNQSIDVNKRPTCNIWANDTDMFTLYENYTAGGYDQDQVNASQWMAQTFTPTVSHYVTKVKIFALRSGTPGTAILGIRAVNATGDPTGSDLCNGTLNADQWSGSFVWRTFNMTTPYLLNAGTQYAIVLRAPLGTSTKYVWWFEDWYGDGSYPTYDGGYFHKSKNSGGNWSDRPGEDFIFREYGGALTVNFYENTTTLPSPPYYTWVRRQTNISAVANSTIQWNYSQATAYSNKYYWKATIDDGTKNTTRLYYFTTRSAGHVPTTYLITPKNQSIDVNKQPKCRIWANDSGGGTLAINFYENSTGSWIKRQLNSSIANQTVQWNYTQATSYGTKYYWKTTIYNGTTNISNTYYFTTKVTPSHIPTAYLIEPKNQSTNVNKQPNCRIWTNDTGGGTLAVSFYDNSSVGYGWIKRFNDSVPANVTVQWNYSEALSYSTKYWWKVTIDDGTTNITRLYYFTTKAAPLAHIPTTSLVTPQNQSNVIQKQPKCRIWANDTNLTIYERYTAGDADWDNAFGAIFLCQTFTVGNTGSNVAHYVKSVSLRLCKESSGSNPGTFYVGIKATDGAGKPTGSYLCQGTSNGNSLPVWPTRVWREINFTTPVLLSPGTKYAIIVNDTAVGTSNRLLWTEDASSPTYGGGTWGKSNDSGATWWMVGIPGGEDFMFKVIGGSLTVNFYENSTGAPTPIWVKRQKNASMPTTSIIEWNYTQANTNGTKYWWKVTIDDGTTNISNIYCFTIAIHVPTIYLIIPKNQSAYVSLQPKCRIWANDTSPFALYESYEGYENEHDIIYGAVWMAQTFTIGSNGSNASHYVTSIKIKAARSSYPGNAILGIRAVNATGDPTGSDLCNGTLNADLWSNVTYTWHEFNMTTPYLLNAGTQYAIVVKAPLGTISKHVDWREQWYNYNATPPTYDGGYFHKSKNSGGNWSDRPGEDFTFKEYGGAFIINFYENSTGSYIRRQENHSFVENSIFQWNYTQASSNGTKYYWKATVYDGAINISNTYYFTTTASIHAPTTHLITPKNQTTNVNKKPKCRIWANDTAGGTLTVNFYENSTGSWIKRQLNSSMPANSTVQWNYSQANINSTKYYWKTTIDDGTTNLSKTYWFAVKTGEVIVYLITPKNRTTNINHQPKVKIWANDTNSTLYERYTEGDDDYAWAYQNITLCQTFTVGNTGSNVAHYVTSVSLRISKFSGTNPGTFYVGIKATDGAGKPTGSYLCQGTSNGNTVATWPSLTWREINFTTPYLLAASTKYAIVVNDTAATFTNRLLWANTSTGTYGGGTWGKSNDSGATWWISTTGKDFMFREWGGRILTINFYENFTSTTVKAPEWNTSDNHWVCKQKNTSVPANSLVQWNYTPVTSTSYGNKYHWKVTVNDSMTNLSKVYWFTLKAGVVTTYLITPKNQSTNVNKQPKCKIWMNDTDPYTLYENYTANDNAIDEAYGGTWMAQTFTVGSSGPNVSHYVNGIKILTRRVGSSPGTVTVGIRAVNETGDPTGNDLCNGTRNANIWSKTVYGWHEFNMTTPYLLNAGTQYAIVLRAPSGTVDNRIYWREDYFGYGAYPTYNGGYFHKSKNSGGNWSDRPGEDFMFMESGGAFTINFYENSTGSWIKRQKNTSVPTNQTFQWNYSQASLNNTKYWWKTTIDDGTTNISRIYWFRLRTGVLTTYLITPKNETININRQPKCRIWANSSGNALTVNFYSNSTGSWIRRQTNASGPANSTVQWNYSQATSNGTTYFWKTTIYDGTANISRTYFFTTKGTNTYIRTLNIIQQITQPLLLHWVQNLTKNGKHVTGTQACRDVAKYIYRELRNMSIWTVYHNWTYAGYTSSNVVATINGTNASSTRIHIISAHMDTVNGATAGGADDDSSGVVAALTAAYFMRNERFNDTIKFVFFSGEEQGMYGSKVYAFQAKANSTDISEDLNVDMISYSPGTSQIRIYHDGPSFILYNQTSTFNRKYYPYLRLNIIDGGTGGYQRLSDQASFWDQGYKAIFFFEATINPYYHTAYDNISHMNLSFWQKYTKLTIATLSELAGLTTGTSISNFQISGYTVASGHKRHAVDNLNFSATITDATQVYINIFTPRGNTINQSILSNHSAITNSYWCNRNFSNGKNHAQTGYGWPDVSCGNGTYQVYVFAKGISGSAKSSTILFRIYPNADVTMDNYTTFVDLTSITGTNWGLNGANRFCRQDVNGDGYVTFNDLTFVTGPKNWGWSNTP